MSTVSTIQQTPQDTWRAHYATAAGFRRWPSEALVRAVGDRRFSTVVEAGCGNGANLWFLAEHADRVIGVDFSDEALAAASVYIEERGCAAQVELHHSDVQALPLGEGSADALVDSMVSQHLDPEEHLAAYREYRRVLRKGGWLWVYHLAAGTDASVFGYEGHFCLPLASALMRWIGESGFTV